MYNDELGAPPAVPQFTPNRSKRNRIILIVVILLLLLGGGLLWWFVLRDKPAKPNNAHKTTNNQQQSTDTPTTASQHTLLLKLTKQSVGNNIVKLNIDSQDAKTLISTDDYLTSWVELPDGAVRTMISKSAPDGDNSAESIIVQDNGKPAKTVYNLVTSRPADGISKTLWAGTLSAEGSRVYFYEADNNAHTARIAYVDVNSGVVTDVITYKASDGKTGLGQFKGVLTPDAVSADNNTIYFTSHSCLNCDGPGSGDLIAYNVSAKTYATLFTSPADQPNGTWAKLNDNYFAIQTSSLGGVGTASYESTVAAKDRLSLYDVRANKVVSVFEHSGDLFGHSLGMATDNKTFYYYTEKVVKDSALADDGGHDFHTVTNEIRAFTVTDNKATKLSLPLDATGQKPLFLTSNGAAYIYGASGRSGSTQDFNVYRTAMNDTKQKVTVDTFSSTDYGDLSLLGYAAKQ
jgi:cytoskeletal protein RodZ